MSLPPRKLILTPRPVSTHTHHVCIRFKAEWGFANICPTKRFLGDGRKDSATAFKQQKLHIAEQQSRMIHATRDLHIVMFFSRSNGSQVVLLFRPGGRPQCTNIRPQGAVADRSTPTLAFVCAVVLPSQAQCPPNRLLQCTFTFSFLPSTGVRIYIVTIPLAAWRQYPGLQIYECSCDLIQSRI